MYVRKKFYHQRSGKKKFFPKLNHPLSFSFFVLPGFPGLFQSVPVCQVPGLRTSYLYLRACLYQASQPSGKPGWPAFDLPSWLGSCLISSQKCRCVFMGRQAGPLAEISARATGVPASRGSPPSPINTTRNILRGNKA